MLAPEKTGEKLCPEFFSSARETSFLVPGKGRRFSETAHALEHKSASVFGTCDNEHDMSFLLLGILAGIISSDGCHARPLWQPHTKRQRPGSEVLALTSSQYRAAGAVSDALQPKGVPCAEMLW